MTLPLSAQSDTKNQTIINFGNIVKFESVDGFSDNFYFEGAIPISPFFLKSGVILDINLENNLVYVLLEVDKLFDFLSIRLNSIYNSFHNYNLAEFTVLNSYLLYLNMFELEAGIGWQYLFDLTDTSQSFDKLHYAYRLEWHYLNHNIFNLSFQISNFSNFFLGNISDVSFSSKNIFVINKNFEVDLFLNFKNPGSWAFCSYYSGLEVMLGGVYRFEN